MQLNIDDLDMIKNNLAHKIRGHHNQMEFNALFDVLKAQSGDDVALKARVKTILDRANSWEDVVNSYAYKDVEVYDVIEINNVLVFVLGVENKSTDNKDGSEDGSHSYMIDIRGINENGEVFIAEFKDGSQVFDDDKMDAINEQVINFINSEPNTFIEGMELFIRSVKNKIDAGADITSEDSESYEKYLEKMATEYENEHEYYDKIS